MTETTILPAPQTALRRFSLLAGFYWPALRRQTIIYPTVTVLLVIAGGLLSNYVDPGFLSAFLSMVFAVMFYWSVLPFAAVDHRAISSQLPVTAWQKLGFLLLFTYIWIPLLLYVSSFAATLVLELSDLPTVREFVKSSRDYSELTHLEMIGVYFLVLPIQLGAICGLVLPGSGRSFKIMFWPIGIAVLMGLILGAIGVVIGFCSVWLPNETKNILQSLSTEPDLAVTAGFFIVALPIIAIQLCKCIKKLRYSGF